MLMANHVPTPLAPRELPSMATHSLEALGSLLDDRIGILERDVTKYSPAKQVFGSISAILALTRVSTLALILS